LEGLTLHYRVEDEPMGTAGPIAFSADLLRSEEPGALFFVFNSDVACDFPLTDMIEFHRRHKGEGTIAVTRVKDPSKYGVIVTKPDANEDDDIASNQIERFVEKPKKFVSDNINAGLYLFNLSILDRIPNEPCSIERQIFPDMASD
jgi:mannose-1-phosphate guanylyltransferase